MLTYDSLELLAQQRVQDFFTTAARERRVREALAAAPHSPLIRFTFTLRWLWPVGLIRSARS
jgi:hypothetical protein